MDYKELKDSLDSGLSTRQISRLFGIHRNTVSYWIHKYNLTDSMRYKKPIYIDDKMFNKIDTKQKAYILGYVLADAAVSDDCIEISCALGDVEILEFISDNVGCNIITDNTLDLKARRFPRARVVIGNKNIVTDILKHGGKKNSRRVPIVPKDLDRFLLLGFFDGDGCITWGKRKDRDRLWHKISFTSSLKLLTGVQNILINRVGISSSIKPKSGENCFVLEFANREDVVKFIDYIYPDDDFIVLNRKNKKAKALRLELDEFREHPKTLSEAV